LREGAVGEHGAGETVVRCVEGHDALDQGEHEFLSGIGRDGRVVEDGEEGVCCNETSGFLSVNEEKRPAKCTYPIE
jgi:hypothetical protein